MNITPSLVIDGIMVVVLLSGALKGFREGFFTAAIRLMGHIGSILGGLWISSNYSRIVFEKYLRNTFIQRTYSYLEQTAQSVDVNTAVNNILGNIPEGFLQDTLKKAEIDLSGVIAPTQASAVTLVDNLLAPVITAVVSVLLFLAAFLVIKLVCNGLGRIFKAINSVPVIGTLNKFAGFGAGAVTGIINIILLSLVLSIIVMVSGDSIPFLNTRVLNGSRVLAYTAALNPFI